MPYLALIFAYWKKNYGRILLSVFVMSVCFGVITVINLLHANIENRLLQELHRTHLIVGAKGSPLQLLLSCVFHLDDPTGNILLKDVKSILHHPMIERAIPISIGDSYKNHRIVGTSPQLIEHYRASLSVGRIWKKPMEIVAGAYAARRLNLSLGNTFHSTHGINSKTEHTHENLSYSVVGILSPCGLTIDNLLLTDTSSIWLTHLEHETPENQHTIEALLTSIPEDEKQITALLLTFKTPAALIQFPKWINQKNNLITANPAYEIGRLNALIDKGLEIVSFLIGISFVTSCITVIVTLFSLLQERKTDLALLRLLGASHKQIVKFLCIESVLIVFTSCVLGMTIGFVFLFSFWETFNWKFWPTIALLPAVSIVVGIGIALPIVVRTYQRTIIQILNQS
ncbi:MAG: ABC transporter permease [Cytophagales bacterium]|nr:ABC transporter permease [Cytophagales bacterium]MDW8383328.1 ABC transporter permease [Flammeovirgaceae bacterium]